MHAKVGENVIDIEILGKLNQEERENRLQALEVIAKDTSFRTPDKRYVNNHIHSTYSFSPYSPTAVAFAAKEAGLATAGIVDHDSIGGAKEFLRAGEIVGIPTTIGMECRVSMTGTRFEEIRTNNPDQPGISYVTIHAVPHDKIDELQEYFSPFRAKRNERNRQIVDNINNLLGKYEISIDFDNDVLPLTMHHDGGTVTERHLLFALAKKIIAKFGRGSGVKYFLERLNIELSEKQAQQICDNENQFYEYDLLGILKSAFITLVYVPATAECPLLAELSAFVRKIGAIACYAYLGDVTDSVTGDKKAQKFEDEYLEELLQELLKYRIKAITYMPTRNTREQITRLRGLCDKYGMLQISGEDVNSPRQSFVIKAMEDPLFSNLIDSTWALIRHERGEEKIIL
jgi:hypothetical protein